MQIDKQDCKYWPFFCEENIWHLCLSEKFKEIPGKVVFISNANRTCTILNQQMGKGEPVIWDYHVVLLVQNKILDFDTLLSFPCEVSLYLEKSFNNRIDENFRPNFRLIDSKDYIDTFASDRRHMLDANNVPLHPFPPWPAIHAEKGSTLNTFIEMERKMGDVFNLEQMEKHCLFTF